MVWREEKSCQHIELNERVDEIEACIGDGADLNWRNTDYFVSI